MKRFSTLVRYELIISSLFFFIILFHHQHSWAFESNGIHFPEDLGSETVRPDSESGIEFGVAPMSKSGREIMSSLSTVVGLNSIESNDIDSWTILRPSLQFSLIGDFNGEGSGENLGENPSISVDGARLTIETLFNDGIGSDAGYTRLFTLPAAPQGPQLLATSPSNLEADIPKGSSIVLTFNENMDASTFTFQNVQVRSSLRGVIAGNWSVTDSIATFIASDPYRSGESITVLVTEGIQDATGSPILNPTFFEFIIESALVNNVAFVEHTASTGMSGPYKMDLGDIDVDGEIDIAIGAYTGDRLHRLENNSLAQTFTRHDLSTGNARRDVFITDQDDDGNMDILSCRSTNDLVVLHEQNSSGVFSVQTISTNADYVRTVQSIDVNLDGLLDITEASYHADRIRWFEQNSSGGFAAHTVNSGSSDGPDHQSWADMDGDGDLDVVVTSMEDNEISWYENDGQQNFQQHIVASNVTAEPMFIGDLDQDGDLDIITDHLGSSLHWYENDGNQNFSLTVISTGLGNIFNMEIVDMNGDGAMDILISEAVTSQISWFENNGSHQFTQRVIASNAAYKTRKVGSADMDNDGDLDVVVACFGDNTVRWYEAFEPVQLVSYSPENGAFNTGQGINWTLHFNGPIDQATLAGNINITSSTLGAITPASITVLNDTSIRIYDQFQSLLNGALIAIDVNSALTDTLGRSIAQDYSVSFAVGSSFPLGGTIEGEYSGDEFGRSLALADNAEVLIAGTYKNDDGGTDAGHVRVYELLNGQWSQIGTDLNGASAGDKFGSAVAISDNGSYIAISATDETGNNSKDGVVRTYSRSGNVWTQFGQDIIGESAFDYSGSALSFNAAGNIIAIGAKDNDGNGSTSGHVRVYAWDGTSWNQRGSDLDGAASWDRFGTSVSLSDDGNTLAIGADGNDAGGSSAGQVKVYQWNGSTWNVLGSPINGLSSNFSTGKEVALSGLGQTIAVGETGASTGGYASGQVRVFDWDGSQWVQKGSALTGSAYDVFGSALDLTRTGDRMVVGVYSYDGQGGGNSGAVLVRDYLLGDWVDPGINFYGNASLDNLGWKVSMNNSGDRLAYSAIGVDNTTADEGIVQFLGIVLPVSIDFQLLSHTPSDGQTNISNSATIQLVFDENVDPLSINNQSIQITGTQSGTISYTSQVTDSIIIITPTSTFIDGEGIDVSIGHNIMSLNGDTLYLGANFHFWISSGAGVSAPNFNLTSAFGQPNGEVTDFAQKGDTLFVAGEFTEWGQPSSGMTIMDLQSGQAIQGISADFNINNSVLVAEEDGHGGYFIGGYFTKINDQSRPYLTHIRGDGSLYSWNPQADGYIQDMKIYNGILYCLGGFQNIGGQVRRQIAAIDTATGLALSFDPNSGSTSANQVYTSMDIHDSIMYVVGNFSGSNSLGGATRNKAGAIDLATGLATAWNPQPNSSTNDVLYYGGKVYLSGHFTALRSPSSNSWVSRKGYARVDDNTGELDNWNVNSNKDGTYLAAHNGKIYTEVAGTGGSVGGVVRDGVIQLDTNTALASSWNPGIANSVHMVVQNGQLAFVGLLTLTTQSGTHSCVFVDPLTAQETIMSGRTDGIVKTAAFSSVSNSIFLGGNFRIVNGEVRHGLAALDLTSEQLLPLQLSLSGTSHVDHILVHNDQLFINGSFTDINSSSYSNFAVLNLSSNQVTSWGQSLSLNTAFSDLALYNDIIFFGGTNGTIRAIDIPSEQENTSWNLNTNFSVRTLKVYGDHLYVGGLYSSLGGTAVNGLGRVDLNTGLIDSWNPNANQYIYDIVVRGGQCYVGGSFSTIGGENRDYLARLSTSSNQASSWNPDAGSSVWAIEESGGRVYAGGDFTQVAGQPFERLVAIDHQTGQPFNWTPNPNGRAAAFHTTSDALFVGGWFTEIGGQQLPYFAYFKEPQIAPVVATGNATGIGYRSARLNGNVTDSGASALVGTGFLIDTNNTVSFQSTVVNTGNSLGSISDSVQQLNPGATYYAKAFAYNSTDTAYGELKSFQTLQLQAPQVFTDSISNISFNDAELNGRVFDNGGDSLLQRGFLIETNPVPSLSNGYTAVSGSLGYMGSTASALQVATTYYVRAYAYNSVDTGYGQILSFSTNVYPNFEIQAQWPQVKGSVYALAPDGRNGWYLGGQFDSVGGMPRMNLAHIDQNGLVSSWTANTNHIVRALAYYNGMIYVGGGFTQIDGQSRDRLASIDTNGIVSSWNPGASAYVYALEPTADGLYVGGAFGTIDGQSRSAGARFDWNTMQVDSWDAGADGRINSFKTRNDTVFIGGTFSRAGGYLNAGGESRPGIATLDASNGNIHSSWDPAWIGSLGSEVVDLELIGSHLYLATDIRRLYWTAQNYKDFTGLIRMSTADASVDTSSNYFGFQSSNQLNALERVADLLMVGGNYDTLQNENRDHLASVYQSNLQATYWRPEIDDEVLALSYQNGKLAVGGSFQEVNNEPRWGFAVFEPVQPCSFSIDSVVAVNHNQGVYQVFFSNLSGTDYRVQWKTDTANTWRSKSIRKPSTRSQRINITPSFNSTIQVQLLDVSPSATEIGCVFELSIPCKDLVIQTAEQRAPRCAGDSALLRVGYAGGYGTKNILWSNGSTVKRIYAQQGQTLTVTVSDGTGCSVSDSITATQLNTSTAPTNMIATRSAALVTARWSPSSFNANQSLIGYRVNYRLRNTVAWSQTTLGTDTFKVIDMTNEPSGNYEFAAVARYRDNGTPTTSNRSCFALRGWPGISSKNENSSGVSIGRSGEINIYPNPVSDVVFVEAPEGSTFQLTDMQGKVLCDGNAKEGRTELDISNYASGVYLLNIKTDDEIITKQIIKN